MYLQHSAQVCCTDKSSLQWHFLHLHLQYYTEYSQWLVTVSVSHKPNCCSSSFLVHCSPLGGLRFPITTCAKTFSFSFRSTSAIPKIPKSPKRQVAFKHLNKGEGSIHNLLLKVLLTHLSKSLPRGLVHTALVPVPPGLPPSLTPVYPRTICWAKSSPSPCPTECLRAPNDHYPSHYFPSGWLVAIKVIYTVRYKHVFVVSFAV